MPGATPVSGDINGPVTGGDNFTFTVTMDQTVPTDTMISLASSNTAVVSGPSSATVPAGQSSVVVPFSSSPVSSNTNVTLTASANGGSAAKTFPVLAKSPP